MDRFEGYGQSSSSLCCRDFSLPQSALGLFYETHETSLNSGFVPAALPLTHKHTQTHTHRETESTTGIIGMSRDFVQLRLPVKVPEIG